jgi:hypothetical protein
MMDVENDDVLLDDGREDDRLERESSPAHGRPLWPWLILLGLLTIGIGVVGALG